MWKERNTAETSWDNLKKYQWTDSTKMGALDTTGKERRKSLYSSNVHDWGRNQYPPPSDGRKTMGKPDPRKTTPDGKSGNNRPIGPLMEQNTRSENAIFGKASWGKKEKTPTPIKMI